VVTYHVQDFNRVNARLEASLLFQATAALHAAMTRPG
jgi:hypothetical protein